MPDNDNIPDRETVLAAIDVLFGNSAEARRWLRTYNPDLGATPMDCLATVAGCEQVMATIGRIEHGVFK